MGLGVVEYDLVCEAMARTPTGIYVFGCQASDAGDIEILFKYVTLKQRERYLTPLVEGRICFCFSMTEPDQPSSNPMMLDTTAVVGGDD